MSVYYIHPTPPLGQDKIQGRFFKQSLIGLNSEFSFSLTSCLTKAEEASLPYYLPIFGGRIIGFIPFPRVLVLCEMQLAWSNIWTRVALSISYDDNHYTTGLLVSFRKFNRSWTYLYWTLFYFASNYRILGYYSDLIIILCIPIVERLNGVVSLVTRYNVNELLIGN